MPAASPIRVRRMRPGTRTRAHFIPQILLHRRADPLAQAGILPLPADHGGSTSPMGVPTVQHRSMPYRSGPGAPSLAQALRSDVTKRLTWPDRPSA